MLLKWMLLSTENYEKSLRQRRLVAAALLAVGIVGFFCYFLLIPESSLPEFAQGFYLGAASGISAGALILLFRAQYLLGHPEARKKARVRETDEREQAILKTAFQTAGVVTFFAAVAALFVILPLSREAFWTLFAVIIFYSLAFLLANGILERKL